MRTVLYLVPTPHFLVFLHPSWELGNTASAETCHCAPCPAVETAHPHAASNEPCLALAGARAALARGSRPFLGSRS